MQSDENTSRLSPGRQEPGMKVLMVADGLWNGGAERQMQLLASSLPEGWSASVASLQDGEFRPVFEAAGVKVYVAPRRFRLDVTPALRIWRFASAEAPDVVHSWGWMSTLAMYPYCRFHGIPLISGSIRTGRLPKRRAKLDRLSVRVADLAIANSRAGLRAYGVTEGFRGRVVYNGFDETRMSGLPSAAAPHEDTVVVMAARMFAEKDWRLLISTARVLSAESPGWRFIGLGSGPDRDLLVSEAADLIAAGVVGFPPGGLEVLRTIAEADVGVLLTDPRTAAEGCSNAIMEYMACGLPVICTDSGGNPELVEAGTTGLLVPPRDVGALVEALRSLRGDPDRARGMGRAGARRLRERFTVGTMVAGFVSAYEAVRVGPGGKRSKPRSH
jgi:glycosyltransferase involved in cell wall biosynthesis